MLRRVQMFQRIQMLSNLLLNLVDPRMLALHPRHPRWMRPPGDLLVPKRLLHHCQWLNHHLEEVNRRVNRLLWGDLSKELLMKKPLQGYLGLSQPLRVQPTHLLELIQKSVDCHHLLYPQVGFEMRMELLMLPQQGPEHLEETPQCSQSWTLYLNCL